MIRRNIDNNNTICPLSGCYNKRWINLKTGYFRGPYCLKHCKRIKAGYNINDEYFLMSRLRKHNGEGTITSEGYKQICINYRLLHKHRLVWEKHRGKIPESYHIHHINRNRLDNRISNLQLISPSEHARLHGEDCNQKTNCTREP